MKKAATKPDLKFSDLSPERQQRLIEFTRKLLKCFRPFTAEERAALYAEADAREAAAAAKIQTRAE